MLAKKNIALVAHDNCKQDLAEWARWNREILKDHHLICTGTTGKMIELALAEGSPDRKAFEFNIRKLKSGPLGGDQQLGAMIVNGEVDMLIFFWDPMQPQPHDVDVKALLRISVLYNIPTACNRSSADFIISSGLLNHPYRPVVRDYTDYINRKFSY